MSAPNKETLYSAATYVACVSLSSVVFSFFSDFNLNTVQQSLTVRPAERVANTLYIIYLEVYYRYLAVNH